ncbi:MAG: hypothetical protein K0S09_339 [Sphingobacteriaceae bacterium]|jgi:maltose/maltodextrin transport system substrate-binding protein|nr:hypothetical protein [Sphingobacteriaceae bacterium]
MRRLKVGLIALASFCMHSYAQDRNLTPMGEIALSESLVPIRPGIPGKLLFWNQYAHQFIYAPAFDYRSVSGAMNYRYNITSRGKLYTFESKVPYSPLSSVWKDMPTGAFRLNVIALNASGDSIASAGEGTYYKSSFFNGPYYEPVMPYDQSARTALDTIMNRSYILYWLDHKKPDPSYELYRFAAKVLSSVVAAGATHAISKPGTEDVKRSVQIAEIVADYLLNISFPKGTPLEYFPPTYYGFPHLIGANGSHMRLNNTVTFLVPNAGHAYLDLYSVTKNEKYLEAAKKIAGTLQKTQLPSGTWFFSMDNQTGKPTAENLLIPTAVVNYFDRLRTEFGVKGLEESTAHAVNWLMNNPVKTYNWQAQFEDIKPHEPYYNQSREQACELAIYLMKNKRDIGIAENLIRYAEDQFVIWEHPGPYIDKSKGGTRPSPGWISVNWIAPSVQEQYTYWMPVTRSAGIMLDTYWQAYVATKKDIYLAKAKSIANTLTVVQKENNNAYPGYFTKYTMQEWINGVVYPGRTMMAFQRYLNNQNLN